MKVAEHWLTPVQSIIVAVLTWVLSVPLLLLVERQTRRPSPRFPAAQCPHCNVSLATRTELRIVTATNHCPHCGRQVVKAGADEGGRQSSNEQNQPQAVESLVAELNSSTRPRALPTVEEVCAEGKRLEHFIYQRGKVAYGGMLVFFVIALAYMAMVFPRAGQPSKIEIAPLPILLATGFVWMLVVLSRADMRADSIAVLKCPHCQASHRYQQTRHLVVASRNCPNCGRQVLRQTESEN